MLNQNDISLYLHGPSKKKNKITSVKCIGKTYLLMQSTIFLKKKSLNARE